MERDNKNPLLIIQARTGSSRLPEKIIKPFYGGKSVLEILLSRLQEVIPAENILVATTTTDSDTKICEICNKVGISYFRGDENDVLSRFIAAADEYGAKKIIRICSDNVFLDLEALKKICEALKESDYDYISYQTSTGTPSILTHYGFWTEGVKVDTLKRVSSITSDKLYHEHVTNYIHQHQQEFNCHFFPIDSSIESMENLRLTLDTPEDFFIQQKIFATLKDRNQSINPKNIIEVVKEDSNMIECMGKVIRSNKK